MSSLSGSIAIDKDRSETVAQLTTISNRSIIIGQKSDFNNHRKHLRLQNSSSKKTFTWNRPGQRQSRKQTSSSLQLIDAYRFRDKLRMNNTHFSSLRLLHLG